MAKLATTLRQFKTTGRQSLSENSNIDECPTAANMVNAAARMEVL
jgi:hypothetical protein